MVAASILAIILDFLIGDAGGSWHPVVLIGRLIGLLERPLIRFGKTSGSKRMAGVLLVIMTIALTAMIVLIGLDAAGRFQYGYLALATLLIWSSISPRTLSRAGTEVAASLKSGDLLRARRGLAAFVGRDTAKMGENDIARGAIESIAENTVDGVVAPLLYALLGGPVCAVIYRSVNTMDSMVGYKNEIYRDFGWAAARLDDLLNFVPARLSRYLLALASSLAGKSWRQALKVSFADGRKHASPNSGIPEAAMAGALGIRLGGINSYAGEPVFHGYLGTGKQPEASDIMAAARVSLIVTFIILFCLSAIYLIFKLQ